MIAPTKFWKPRRKNTRPRQHVSVYAAVRLLLPRRLQAQVGNRLDTLGLKAALAELKSYRDPPKAVLQVVTAVLCLLGLGRLSSCSAWQFVRPQLKPSLPKGMLQFAKQATIGHATSRRILTDWLSGHQCANS